jgi:hypothetical protein
MAGAIPQNTQRRHKVSQRRKECLVGERMMLFEAKGYTTKFTKKAQSFTK